MSPLAANTSQRIIAGFIDVAPFAVVTIAVSIFAGPFDVAATSARILTGLYLLIKDITGASPGKWLVGVRVTDRAGVHAPAVRKVFRNLTLASAPMLLGVPYIGRVAAVLCVGEMVLVLMQRERLGDRLAGTTVIRRAVLPETSAA